ncbi:MAG: hypothetical protein U0T36_11860 [Saprospiraceae bacterium]
MTALNTVASGVMAPAPYQPLSFNVAIISRINGGIACSYHMTIMVSSHLKPALTCGALVTTSMIYDCIAGNLILTPTGIFTTC